LWAGVEELQDLVSYHNNKPLNYLLFLQQLCCLRKIFRSAFSGYSQELYEVLSIGEALKNKIYGKKIQK
jgi:hypothetical protein